MTTLTQKQRELESMKSIRKSTKHTFLKEQEDEFENRNKQLYEMLKQCKVCVIPDPKIVTVDKLPQFTIIEGNIKDNVYKEKEKTKQSKLRYQNMNSL